MGCHSLCAFRRGTSASFSFALLLQKFKLEHAQQVSVSIAYRCCEQDELEQWGVMGPGNASAQWPALDPTCIL